MENKKVVDQKIRRQAELMKTGETFLQDAPCFEAAPNLAKCRECRNQRLRNDQQKNGNIFCRFYAFRRLRYLKNGQLVIIGFSDPLKDASEEDLKLWLPEPEKAAKDLDVEMALFLLTHVGDQFCWMMEIEKKAKAEALVAAGSGSASKKCKIAWKRVVQGVRELCDECNTTLFNFHWACGKCGYGVCIDCYKSRRTAKFPSNNGSRGNSKDEEKDKNRDPYGWLFCNSRSYHNPDKLMPTQIIAGQALECLCRLVHTYRKEWNIAQFCDCYEWKTSQTTTESYGGSVSSGSSGIVKESSASESKSDMGPSPDGVPKGSDSPDYEGLKPVNGSTAADSKGQTSEVSSPLSALSKEKRAGKSQNVFGKVEGAIQNSSNDGDNEPSSSDEDEHSSILRELLMRPPPNSSCSSTISPDQISATVAKRQKMETLEDVISFVIEQAVNRKASPDHSASASGNNPPTLSIASPSNPSAASASGPNLKEDINGNGGTKTNGDVAPTETVMEFKYFKRRNGAIKILTREMLPPRIMTLGESEKIYPKIPHSWLCSGKLLRLHDPSNADNSKLFQESWKRGQPVMVSSVTKTMDMSKWHPDSFIKDYGNHIVDLVNCLTGNIVPNQIMEKFWNGFERPTERLKDDKGQPMLLKLKDWPTVEDFANLLPTRFSDLMKALPLSEYTHRDGRFNLAGRLPADFVRPDLGPKMYNAYGSALLGTKGTTNLHLDVADAVNVMLYVGLPKEGNQQEHEKEAITAIENSNVDSVTLNRVTGNGGEIPGALWHIYQASDADRIRDFLNKVALDKGEILEPHHDPIHDQSSYLDDDLRTRLYEEYGVSGYSIVQCLGDAVFIPAGAPHQVRNLHSCIKVAEDFVSPETVAQCFQLTQEFRQLPDSHFNHEDKLQIKNITFHAMKDSIAALAHAKGVTFADLFTIYENFVREEAASN